MIMAQTCKLQQNNFFTEYNLDVDTTIYEYDHIKNEVSELGKVKGCFYNCMVDSEEMYITGLLYDCDEKTTGIVRYDLNTGEIKSCELPDTIERITGTDKWYIRMLYNGGNRFLVSYDDDNKNEMWLFYDIATGQCDIVEGEKHGIVQFLGVYDNTLWYVAFAGGALYQYDLVTKTKPLWSVTRRVVKGSASIQRKAHTMSFDI